MESLLLAYRDEVAASGAYRIPAELVVPKRSQTGGILNGRLRFRRAVYRAYLPSGRWRVIMRGDRLDGVKINVDDRHLSSAERKHGDAQAALTTDVSRWHLIQLEAAAPGAALAEIELKPVSLVAAAGGRNPPPPGRN